MLLAAFLDHFEKLPPERYRTLGASSAGYCARRLAMGHFPERYEPDPMTPRRRARLMAGREFERIVMGKIQEELKAETAGETAFLWAIPCDAETFATAQYKVVSGRLKGHILPGMNPNDIKRWRDACVADVLRKLGADTFNGPVFSRLGGIVLDPTTHTIYIPALSDGIADLAKRPEFSRTQYALATVDFKTMATAGFRRAVRGKLDYSYRTQFAIQVDASGLDTHVGLYYRLETSHGVEVIYSRLTDRVRATFTLTNGSTFTADDSTEPEGEWDELRIETPFEDGLLEQARERMRRVLRSTVDELPAREYGPSFVCDDCDGDGTKKCPYCDADGISKRAKDGKVCGAKTCFAGRATCEKCQRGALQETELGFPCAYCPFLASCYVKPDGTPLYQIVMPKKPGDAGGRPKFMVTRADYEASGSTFTSPEGK